MALTAFKIDYLLDQFLDVLEKGAMKFPFLMNFGIVRDLIKLQKCSDPILHRRYVCGSNNSSQGVFTQASDSTNVITAIRQCRRNNSIDNALSPARVKPAMEASNENDSWGHFADFPDDDQPPLLDPQETCASTPLPSVAVATIQHKALDSYFDMFSDSDDDDD